MDPLIKKTTESARLGPRSSARGNQRRRSGTSDDAGPSATPLGAGQPVTINLRLDPGPDRGGNLAVCVLRRLERRSSSQGTVSAAIVGRPGSLVSLVLPGTAVVKSVAAGGLTGTSSVCVVISIDGEQAEECSSRAILPKTPSFDFYNSC